jgi:hypothetical protein
MENPEKLATLGTQDIGRAQICTKRIRSVGFYSASSLKEQFAGRHVTPPGKLFLIPRQRVCVLNP